MVSVLLVVAALASLLVGLLGGIQLLVYVAIGLSLIGLGVVVYDLWRRRSARGANAEDVEAEEEATEEEPEAAQGPEAAEVAPVVRKPRFGRRRSTRKAEGPSGTVDTAEPSREAPASSVSEADPAESLAPSPVATLQANHRNGSAPSTDTAEVVVVPGRRRYHRAGCTLVDGHRTDTVTAEEAVEEGFSACTKCAPPQPDHP